MITVMVSMSMVMVLSSSIGIEGEGVHQRLSISGSGWSSLASQLPGSQSTLSSYHKEEKNLKKENFKSERYNFFATNLGIHLDDNDLCLQVSYHEHCSGLTEESERCQVFYTETLFNTKLILILTLLDTKVCLGPSPGDMSVILRHTVKMMHLLFLP